MTASEQHQWLADFAVSSGVTQEELDAAEREHVRQQVMFGASADEVKDIFGTGVSCYFKFIYFVVVVDVLLFALQAIHFFTYVAKEDPGFNNRPDTGNIRGRSWYDDFFITLYSNDEKSMWYALEIIGLVVSFLSAPAYWLYIRLSMPSNIDTFRDRLIRYTDTGFVDVSHFYRSRRDRLGRRLLSVLIFAAFILVQVFASWYITKEQGAANFGVAFAIAIVVAVLNTLYGYAAWYLTEFEKWQSFTVWKRAQSMKLMLFKLGNIVTVYAAKDYSSYKHTSCVYDVIGQQFLSIFLVEFIAMNIWEMVLTFSQAHWAREIASWTGSILGDQENLPTFDVATQYLEVFYRQYLGVMAMAVFPLSMAIVVPGMLLSAWVDQFLLYKICGRPKKMVGTQKVFLAICLALLTAAAIATPFAGTGFVLSKSTKDLSKLCPFP